MVIRTFFSKSNTIIKKTPFNLGLYPVVMLNYGLTTSRVLLYFNVDDLKKQIDEQGIQLEKYTHTLKMFNCSSINPSLFNKPIESTDKNGLKLRASSFDLIFMKINKPWDQGVGFDDSYDFWVSNNDSSISMQGSNWYNSKTGIKWENEGVYSDTIIKEEIDKYDKGENSLVIGIQHFDHGNEHININLTDYINGLINGTELNRGIMVLFTPHLELNPDTTVTKYVGFFNEKTNTFFQPLIESKCNETISDDRYNFYLGRENRLYLYTNEDGFPIDLDNLPICEIDGVSYPVTHQMKGVYYASVKLNRDDYSPGMIVSDIWSNISYHGEASDDIENEFTINTMDSSLNTHFKPIQAHQMSITINGISDNEKVVQGQIKEVSVEFKKPYYREIIYPSRETYYRLYIEDCEKEIDIINWDGINVCYEYNYFVINTNELLPHKYFIDIKTKCGRETKLFKKQIEFEVVNNLEKMKA